MAVHGNKEWPGFKVVAGRSIRKFTDETATASAAKTAGFTDIYDRKLINWDVFNAITLAIWIYALIPFWLVELYEWIKRKRQIRRDRKQLAQLLARAEATRDQLNPPNPHHPTAGREPAPTWFPPFFATEDHGDLVDRRGDPQPGQP